MALHGNFLCLILLNHFIYKCAFAQYNEFPSFLNANATLAVIVDRDYITMKDEDILQRFQQILTDVAENNLHNGGINVKYYSWRGIRLKKDTLAAITVMDCKNTWNFFAATRAVNVLQIAITEPYCPRLPFNKGLMIPTVNQGEEFPQLILDARIQNLMTWKNIILLIDETLLNRNDERIMKVMHESRQFNLEPISIIFYSINDRLVGQMRRIALRNILKNFIDHSKKSRQFLIFSILYEDIIEIANVLEMFHLHNEWLFFVLNDINSQQEFNASTVTQNLEEGANIAFVIHNDIGEQCKDSINCIIHETSQAFTRTISQMIAEEQAVYSETSDEEWEAIRQTKDEKQMEILNNMHEYLKDEQLCINCLRWQIITILTWGKTQEQHKSVLSSLDNRNKNFEYINVGYWIPALGFISQDYLFPHVKHYFRNITMNIATVHNPPWQILEMNNNGEIIKHSGIVMDIIKELSRMLNFTYILHNANNIIISSNQTQMDTLPGLTYLVPYEIVASMQTNKYLISAVAATIEDPDMKTFNYTIPISTQRYSFIRRKSKEVSRIYLFTAPFKTETWLCLLGAIFIMAPVLFVVNRFLPISYMKVAGFGNLRNCFWYIYGSLLQQGGIYLPQANSIRLIIGIWWIVVIVLITSYCGNLVAFLTFPRYQPGTHYVFQIFKNNQNKELGLRSGTFFEKHISFSDRIDFHNYLNKAVFYNNTNQENMDAVIKGERINIDWRINLQQNIQKQFEKDKVCKLSISKEAFVDENVGLIMPRDSPYLKLINRKIYRLYQMGFIERWHKTNLPPPDKCQGKKGHDIVVNHKVNMDDMQGCFLVLFFGFILAGMVILFESWYYRWQMKRQLHRILFST